MFNKLACIVFLVALLFSFEIAGQSSDNYRSKTLALTADSTQLDSLSIHPASLVVMRPNGDTISAKNYRLNWQDAYLVWKNEPPFDSLRVSYVVYPLLLSASTQILDKKILIYSGNQQGVDVNKVKPKQEEEANIERSGNITRGVSVGNNQNLYVNSSLDLQLSGEITEGIEIKAALNDRNLPIQPEGTSAQIQEFDNVYIEVSSANTRLSLGDFLVVNQPDDYYLRTFKKAQGASFSTKKSIGNQELLVGGSYAIARGKFSRNVFNGEEGNQGPYRLKGNSGELFIIVVAGSERVYINGESIERGEDNDYTIDYNTGDITFTPNQLITQFDRIIIEFQYTDNSYERSIINGFATGKAEKFEWSISRYAENDNRNKAFFTTLTNEDKQTLALAGDNPIGALKNSEILAEEGYEGVTYQKQDSTIEGVQFKDIYIFSQSPDVDLYRVSFSYLGPGLGNYIESNQNINGRVYKWVAPINGVPQGEYEPVVQLISPKGTALTSGSFTLKPNKYHKLRADLAFSQNDLNRFSQMDSEDDKGYSFRLMNTNENLLHSKDSSKWQLDLDAAYEFKNEWFTPIERYRSVEFERLWNRQFSNSSTLTSNQQEHLFNSTLRFRKLGGYKLELSTNGFNRGTIYRGRSLGLNGGLNRKSFSLQTFNNVVLSSNTDTLSTVNSNFISSKTQIEKRFAFIDLYAETHFEENLFGTNADSLGNQSNGFREYALGIRSPDSFLNSYLAEYRERWVFGIDSNAYAPINLSSNFETGFQLAKNPRNRLSVNVKYRRLQALIATDSVEPISNTLLGRIEYSLASKKGWIRTNSYYQLGTGRERQFEIVYSKVAAGQGTYIWNDLNNNEKQELGEFRVQDYNGQGEYVRLVLNNNSYVPAVANEFSQNISIQPAALWGAKTGVLKGLSKFSNLSVASIKRKTRDNNELSQFNPFNLSSDDVFLISTLSQLRNTLSFNKLNSKFSADYVTAYNTSKNLFTYGFEAQDRIEHIANLRFNFSKIISLLPTYQYIYQKGRSEAFDNKNFNLNIHTGTTKLVWQKGSTIRVSALYNYYNGSNLYKSSIESAVKNTLGAEFNYSTSSTGYLSLNFNTVNIIYEGDLNSPVAFIMLQSLRPGVNYTWQANINFNISSNTNFSVIYDGRKSEETNAIHTGSINVRWLF